MNQAEPAGGSSRGWLWLLAALLAAVAVHAPSLQLGFVGDDFEWWHAARLGVAQPLRLLQPFGGFRLANGWILALEAVVYGTNPMGYHVTSLLFHLACGFALWWALARFSLPPVVRAATVALWLCSPFSLKPAQSLCERFEPLLLISWLAMVAVWPATGQRWTRARVLAVSLLTLVTILSKESWVVLPGLVLCFELCLRAAPLRQALRSTALASAAVIVYITAYFINPPIDSSYFSANLLTAAKVPHCWAVFCSLTRLDPTSTQLGVAEAVAVVMVGGLAWLGWRRRCALTAVGLAFFALPFAPILTVDFLVSRYTYIPLAGFLMVLVAAARAAVVALPPARRPLLVVVLVAVAAASMGHGLLTVAGDMEDASKRDSVHRELLSEMRAFAPQISTDRVLVAIRLERESPNRWLLERIEGVPKPYYERSGHPYSLIRWASLLSYVLDAHGGPLYEEIPADAVGSTPVTVVGHRSGGFVLLPDDAETAAELSALWRQRGYPVAICNPR